VKKRKSGKFLSELKFAAAHLSVRHGGRYSPPVERGALLAAVWVKPAVPLWRLFVAGVPAWRLEAVCTATLGGVYVAGIISRSPVAGDAFVRPLAAAMLAAGMP